GIIKPNNKINCRLSAITEQAIALCESEIIKSNISVTTEIDPTIEDICIDRTYLAQLLINLLRKSLERLPKEGWIKLKCELKELSNKKALKLTIDDNGFLISYMICLTNKWYYKI
ncbi:MAG: sensor histidine kinase, partial [Candidatus Nucleicultricaceae bacterium]